VNGKQTNIFIARRLLQKFHNVAAVISVIPKDALFFIVI
jgi:hypothetical protein